MLVLNKETVLVLHTDSDIRDNKHSKKELIFPLVVSLRLKCASGQKQQKI